MPTRCEGTLRLTLKRQVAVARSALDLETQLLADREELLGDPPCDLKVAAHDETHAVRERVDGITPLDEIDLRRRLEEPIRDDAELLEHLPWQA